MQELPEAPEGTLPVQKGDEARAKPAGDQPPLEWPSHLRSSKKGFEAVRRQSVAAGEQQRATIPQLPTTPKEKLKTRPYRPGHTRGTRATIFRPRG